MADLKKKNLWQQMGRDTEEEEGEETAPAAKPYDWAGLKSRLIGDKNAAETATEEIEKLKKKQGY
jgi:hypothetical protein